MKNKKIVTLSLMALLLSACQVKSGPVSVNEFKKVFEENIKTRQIASVESLKDGKKLSVKYSVNDPDNEQYETYSYELDTTNYAKLADKDLLSSGMSVKVAQGYKTGKITKNDDGTYSEEENKTKSLVTETKLEYSSDKYSLSSTNSYYREQYAHDKTGKAYVDYKSLKATNYEASVDHVLEHEETVDGKKVKVRNDIEPEAKALVDSLFTYQPTTKEYYLGQYQDPRPLPIIDPVLYIEGDVFALNLEAEQQEKGFVFAELDELKTQYVKKEVQFTNGEVEVDNKKVEKKDQFIFRIGEEYYGYNQLANNASRALFEAPEAGENYLSVKETAKYNVCFDALNRKIYVEKPTIKNYDWSKGTFFLRGTIASLEMNEDWENKTLVGGLDNDTKELVYLDLELSTSDEFIISARAKTYDYSKLTEEAKQYFNEVGDGHIQPKISTKFDLVINTSEQTLDITLSPIDADPYLAARGTVASLGLSNDWANEEDIAIHDDVAKTATVAKLDLAASDEFKLCYNGVEYGYEQLADNAKTYFKAEASDNKLAVKEAGSYAICLNANSNKVFVARIVNTDYTARYTAEQIMDIFNNKTLKVIEDTLNDDNVEKEIMTTSTNYIYRSKDAVNGLQEFIINKTTFAISAHHIRANTDAHLVRTYSLSGF